MNDLLSVQIDWWGEPTTGVFDVAYLSLGWRAPTVAPYRPTVLLADRAATLADIEVLTQPNVVGIFGELHWASHVRLVLESLHQTFITTRHLRAVLLRAPTRVRLSCGSLVYVS